ncbi:MAG: ABC transporter permease subunit [Tissierellaceae bacterium]|nr:ABC transporter permease subunit [Tissierellaceae bacterium]
MKYKEFLYDEIGNEYERKNQYLLELARLSSRLKESENKDEIRGKIRNHKKNKDKHPYIIELKNYKDKEKDFLKKLVDEKSTHAKSLDNTLSKRMKDIKLELFEAEKKLNFYYNYVGLTYDAQLEYESSKLAVEQLPSIIEFLKNGEREVNKLEEERNSIDKNNENKINIEIKKFKEELKEVLNKEISRIKEMRQNGSISKKAEKNEITVLKKKYNQAVKLKSFDSVEKANRENIKSKKHEVKSGLKQKKWILRSDISDVKRKVPVETNKTVPFISYLTFLVPGLGQILNKQYIKGLCFFLITLFVYLIAIPYALGYGNYQGNGIAGLITLAEGGKRIDKSLIFMIEGILAIFLVVIGLVLMYVSFRDVNTVEKKRIKGIRSNNWFESYKRVKDEGFPYIVSSPALFVIIFTVLVPITTAVLLSFTGMDPKHQSKFPWAGLENYKLIALGRGLAGEVFWLILFWTIIWTIAATTLAIVIGFVLAILANNERVKGKTFFRSIFILPWAVPAFISIMFFSIMFSPTGALTEIVSNLTGKLIEVKSDPTLTRIVLILLQGWLGSSYIFLLSTGVLQAIPNDLYEAADIDGATGWQKIRHITLPIVLFQTAPLLVGQYTFNFNNFSIIFLFNGGGPFNPTKYGNLAGTSDLLISYIYKLTMDNQYQAIGAAITTLISLGLMFFAFIGYKNSKAFKEERL